MGRRDYSFTAPHCEPSLETPLACLLTTTLATCLHPTSHRPPGSVREPSSDGGYPVLTTLERETVDGSDEGAIDASRRLVAHTRLARDYEVPGGLDPHARGSSGSRVRFRLLADVRLRHILSVILRMSVRPEVRVTLRQPP